jgi:hypothetical protein
MPKLSAMRHSFSRILEIPAARPLRPFHCFAAPSVLQRHLLTDLRWRETGRGLEYIHRLGNDFRSIAAIAPVLRRSSEAASYAAAAVQGFIANLSIATLHRGQPSMIEDRPTLLRCLLGRPVRTRSPVWQGTRRHDRRAPHADCPVTGCRPDGRAICGQSLRL